MKAVSIAFLMVIAALLCACTDPLEKPVTQEASEKFQRGITGHGTLGPMDEPADGGANSSVPNSPYP